MVAAKAAVVAADKALGVGQGVVQAATTPIYSRKTTEVWDADKQEWVPLQREKALEVTPAAVVGAGLIALLTGAVAQRALRTGTVALVQQWEFEVTKPAKDDTYADGIPHGKKHKVWADRPDYLSPVVGERSVATGRTRRRPKAVAREDVAGYGPVVGRLLG